MDQLDRYASAFVSEEAVRARDKERDSVSMCVSNLCVSVTLRVTRVWRRVDAGCTSPGAKGYATLPDSAAAAGMAVSGRILKLAAV